MAILHDNTSHQGRDYRRAGAEDTSEEGGGAATSTLPSLPQIPIMNDDWIDVNAERETGPHSIPSQQLARLDLVSDTQTPVQTTSIPSNVTPASPLRPQNTNNPFFRRKSSSAGDAQASQVDQNHAAAWAELTSGSEKGKAVSFQPMADGQGSSVPGGSYLQSDELHPVPDLKGKGPALDHMGLPNRQESGKIDDGLVIASPSGPPPGHSEYLPPPGPPPGHAESFQPPPGPPPPKNETYQIKHVRWLDSRDGGDTRQTPILMQNLNGPCPLLALVNALTMSTPSPRESSLVEALRTREQVSLRLLLDAVVEELITNRMSPGAELPDMIELYDFLLALHTGMNVNPRLVATLDEPILIDFEAESPQSPPKAPGGFEDTKDMRFYSVFNVPLIHGWLPPPSHPVHAALQRSAKTHEDAENLLTREDELEGKLAKDGLSEDEQRLLEDIATIKYFLSSSATQLTGYGLDIIAETMSPGGFSILFRNNHFSTLYRHPTGQVYSLVTDMGYAKYPEIVWESLVDTNGLGAELFSGDFRGVSHGSNAPVLGTDEFSSNASSKEWTTVNRKGKQSQTTANANEGSSSQNEAASREQEDADLALALQLQEEEESRHRRENSQRNQPQQPTGRRQSSQRTGTVVPATSTTPRRLVVRPGHRPENTSSSSASNNDRPLRGTQPSNSPFQSNSNQRRPTVHAVPPVTSNVNVNADEGPPPPSYEAALSEQPYHPPENSLHHEASPVPSPSIPHARSTGATNAEGTAVNFDELMARAEADPPLITRTRNRQVSTPQMSAYHQLSGESNIGARESLSSAYGASARQRRGSANAGNLTGRERDRDCVMM